MRLQRQFKEEPTVDLTSLIDVVFLLLIFFMVSTTFERQAILEVNLPEASAVDDMEEVPDSLELVIDENGRMFLNDQGLVDSEERTLRAAMERVAGDNRDIPLVLRADRLTPHHYVVTAMDVAAQMGFVNLSIGCVNVNRRGQFPVSRIEFTKFSAHNLTTCFNPVEVHSTNCISANIIKAFNISLQTHHCITTTIWIGVYTSINLVR